MTVMRLSARWPRTVGSKRTGFTASVLVTYTLPLFGRTAMLKMTVPTPVTTPVTLEDENDVASALMRNTSSSGNENGTKALQSRGTSSTHALPLNLTISPVSGAPGVEPGGGAGRPGGLFCGFTTPDSGIRVSALPEWIPAACTVHAL